MSEWAPRSWLPAHMEARLIGDGVWEIRSKATKAKATKGAAP